MSQLKDYRPIVQKYAHIRSRKLLDSSRGQVCTLGFHGCDRGTETTVAAHAGFEFAGKGISIKATDWMSVDACHICHGILDGRIESEYTQDQKDYFFWRAFVKTTNRRIAEGLITIAGSK